MISPFKKEYTAQVAKIHQKALATDFLSSLGFHFLKTIYDNIVNKPSIYGFVFIEKKKVHGFVIGAKNTNTFFKQALFPNFPKVIFFLSIALIKNPKLIKKVFETVLYPSKSDGSSAELVVIAVDAGFRRKGVGKSLVQELEKTFRKEGIRQYKLTVHADKDAIYFYKKLSYHKKAEFMLYGKKWYLYHKKI